jgi:hypothetical protein
MDKKVTSIETHAHTPIVDVKRLKLVDEFSKFFTASTLKSLYGQLFNNTEVGFYVKNNTTAVSPYLLSSFNRNYKKRNTLFRFMFDKGLYNFCCVSVSPDVYTVHIQLSNGKVLTREGVHIGNRLAGATRAKLAYTAIRDMYIAHALGRVEYHAIAVQEETCV